MSDDGPTAARDVARSVFGESFGSIKQYVDLLASTGVDWGLIGPRETGRLWDRHVLNSVAVADLISVGSSVVDVGSGAGLPGLPLAILRGDLEITLLEPLLRRATFLTDAVHRLDLGGRVRVVRARAEDHDVRYDVVVSRAVAPLDRLVGWCAPLCTSAGEMLAMKGQSAAAEVASVAEELRRRRLEAEIVSVRAHPSVEATTVVRVRAIP